MRQTIQETVTENNIITTLTTAVIESHLRVTYSADSAYLDLIAYAAQEAVQNEIGEVFGSAVITVTNSEFVRDFTLPYPAERVAVSNIKYFNENNVETSLAEGSWETSISGYPTVVEIDPDAKPTSLTVNSPVVMKITVAMLALTIPKALQQAVLLMMGHMYENREAVLSGRVVEPPLAFKYLCNQYKRSSIRQPFNPEMIVR